MVLTFTDEWSRHQILSSARRDYNADFLTRTLYHIATKGNVNFF